MKPGGNPRNTIRKRIQNAPLSTKFEICLHGEKINNAARLVATCMSAVARPENSELVKEARRNLSEWAWGAMVNDNSKFFLDLAEAMDKRRIRKRDRIGLADPERAMLFSLLHSLRWDGKKFRKLTNPELTSAMDLAFPKREFDERVIRRLKKDLLAADK